MSKRDEVTDEFALEVLTAHTAYFKHLGASGKCLVAGPFAEQNIDRNGSGFYVLIAQDEVEANNLAASDPLVVEGLYDFNLREWHKVVPE
jgi:uncharacterized protein YciI